MKNFYLCSGLRTAVPAELLGQLQALPEVRIARARSGIVQVEVDGAEADLQALLVGTAWSSFHVSESRTYHLQ